MRITGFALAIGVLVNAGCSPVDDLRFRNEGAGVALFTEKTAAHTANLTSYFRHLCLQAGFESPGCAPKPNVPAPDSWKLLVETGYNDIDFRCDSYLNWIDEKRSQRIMVDGTSNALGTLVTGVLAVAGVGVAEIVYTALSLGFAKSAYDFYHNSILLGLEGSTIKEVVNQRRATHREEFSKREYRNRAEAVFALRQYLTFCTPQAILTDVNTLSRSAARGDAAGMVKAQAERSAALVGSPPPTSDTDAGPGKRNETVLTLSDKVARVFEGKAFTVRDVETLQRGSCIAVDGDVGTRTKSAVRIVEQTIRTVRANGKLDAKEWALVEGTLKKGCLPGLKNHFENFVYAPDFGKAAVNKLVGRGVEEFKDLRDKDLRDSDVREALTAYRARLSVEGKFSESFPGLDVSDQITPGLRNHLKL